MVGTDTCRCEMARRTSARVPKHLGKLQGAADFPTAPTFTELLSQEANEPGLRKGDRTRRRVLLATAAALAETPFAALNMDQIAKRSEERRVGKECRSRWSPDH